MLVIPEQTKTTLTSSIVLQFSLNDQILSNLTQYLLMAVTRISFTILIISSDS